MSGVVDVCVVDVVQSVLIPGDEDNNDPDGDTFVSANPQEEQHAS